ncbi:DUF6216 family protein [Tatumella sp. OPLPL6]|uniref:DUF6216 family protein n=1 Tax=Tatumella sp. OPLPL6 TaxID=1928657 RepID=UPI000C188806|nr:DUF6216 family protein [Tatumella sp. OPLPL6]PIJ46386.1 hypothetical protein BOM24_01040 [Tatumella sp. OPLPL6]
MIKNAHLNEGFFLLGSNINLFTIITALSALFSIALIISTLKTKYDEAMKSDKKRIKLIPRYLFLVKIRTDSIPKFNKFSSLGSIILLGLFIIYFSVIFSHMLLPKDTLILQLNKTKEWFYLDKNRASSTSPFSFFNMEKWSIDYNECKLNYNPSEIKINYSKEVFDFTCNLLKSNEKDKFFSEQLKSEGKLKTFLKIEFSIILIVFAWYWIKLCFYTYYSWKIKRIILKEHEIAVSYINPPEKEKR